MHTLLLASSDSAGAITVAVIAFVVVAILVLLAFARGSEDSFHRGRRLLSYSQAKTIADKARCEGDSGIPWGGLRIASAAAQYSFAAVGCSGSGKSITIRLQMQEVLPLIGDGRDIRALVYDGKREWLPYLYGMGLRCPIKILNPFDARCCAWDIAADCTSPAVANEIAQIMFPDQQESQPYFTVTSRNLLSGALIVLHTLSPRKWTLRDILLLLENHKHFKHALQLVPETRNRLVYFEKEATLLDTFSTIATKMAEFRPIAAGWSRACEKVSLEDWVRNEYILILSTDDSIRASLDLINRVIFKRASELILSQTESEKRATWILADELREAGRLDGLNSLLVRGRSFGARVVMGFQDIDGLRHVYGDNVANEIVGQCGNKAILRLESPETAKWAAQVLGEAERYERQTSVTHGEKSTTTVTNQLVKRETLLPSQFMTLPPTSRENGLSGYYLSPYVGAFKAKIDGAYLATALKKPDPSEPSFVPRPAEHQYLQPWTQEDLNRLHLPFSAADCSAPTQPSYQPPHSKLKVVRKPKTDTT